MTNQSQNILVEFHRGLRTFTKEQNIYSRIRRVELMGKKCGGADVPPASKTIHGRLWHEHAGTPALPAQTKMLGPGCALPFTSGPHKATHLAMRDRTVIATNLVTRIFVANLVRVNSCGAATRNRSNDRALRTAEQST